MSDPILAYLVAKGCRSYCSSIQSGEFCDCGREDALALYQSISVRLRKAEEELAQERQEAALLQKELSRKCGCFFNAEEDCISRCAYHKRIEVKISSSIQLQEELTEVKAARDSYKADAEYLRKWRQIKGRNPGIPCACEFGQDGETPIVWCSVHAKMRDALKFYAEQVPKMRMFYNPPTAFHHSSDESFDAHIELERDKGKRARDALALEGRD